jgi:hypothetical protein
MAIAIIVYVQYHNLIGLSYFVDIKRLNANHFGKLHQWTAIIASHKLIKSICFGSDIKNADTRK